MLARRLLWTAALALIAPVAIAQDDPSGDAPANPHAGGAGAAQMFQPPPDVTDDDPRIPVGAVAITILDPDNKPIPGINVTLGILHQSIAKGESREHKNASTDANGEVHFDGLTTGSSIAYRVSVVKDGGSFWAMPFQLAQDKGERVQLHVYPVTHDIDKALIVTQLAVYAEMKDDRVQLEQAITFYNLGKTAWVPDDLTLALPKGFTALNGQQGMTDQGVDPVDGVGAKIRGTFPPGQHPIEFRWQLPYSGEANVVFDEGVPPNMAIARVMAAASQQMHLVATGFPEAEPQQGNNGERLLITEKQIRRGEKPMRSLHVELRDLPTAGPARWIATSLAAFGVLAGVGYAFVARKDKPASAAKDLRARLLEELEELERARRDGDVGPKTYERARRELIDAIARTLAKGDAKT